MLKYFWSDIREGKNVDCYVAILTSAAIAVCSVFDLLQEKYLIAGAVLILTVLINCFLNTKAIAEAAYQLILQKETRANFLIDFPAKFKTDLECAHELWFLGVHLKSALTAYYEILEKKLKEGKNIRFLLVSPFESCSLLATKRFAGNIDEGHERERIFSSLKTLLTLKGLTGEYLKIKIIEFPVDSTVYIMNPNEPNAIIYLERCTYKISGGVHKPKFIFSNSDEQWFRHIKGEFDLMWNDAQELDELKFKELCEAFSYEFCQHPTTKTDSVHMP